MKAKISEIFASIQGEGIYAGTKHIFIRFAGCNIECRYCDTKKKKFKEYTVPQLISEVDSLNKKNKADYLSLTGGEPLLQADFIEKILGSGKLKNFKIYLETNGLLSDKLKMLKKYIDIIAMDIKLPSVSGIKGLWDEHEEFLKTAKTKKVFVKTVVGLDTEKSEIEKTAVIIAGAGKDIPLVLQPEHSQLSRRLIDKCMEWQNIAANKLRDVRVIPQMHKIMGVR